MTIVYERYKHSASSGNTFLECPSAFLWRWGLKNWGETKASMAMGTAAEEAAWLGLSRGFPDGVIRSEAESAFVREMKEEVTDDDGDEVKELGMAGEIAVQFTHELRRIGQTKDFVAYQPETFWMVGDLERPIRLKPDFIFEGLIVDTKATKAVPSKPKPMHVRQQALYAVGRGKSEQVKLLYSSGKKTSLIDVPQEDLGPAHDELIQAFRQIEALDQRFQTVEQAMSIIPLGTDSFYWGDDDAIKAKAMWKEAMNVHA